MAYEGGTSGEAFLRFVREALVPSLHEGDVVVLDNLGAHRAAGVRESKSLLASAEKTSAGASTFMLMRFTTAMSGFARRA